jgi:hypothetical protein
MAAAAKSKTLSREMERYRQSVAEEVSREARTAPDVDRFVFRSQSEKSKRGAPRKPVKEKARLATFSLTAEDLRFVEKATYQVILALQTGVNKSQTVRLAMRAVAGLSIEELRKLLQRTPARELSEQITHGARV